MLRRLFRVTHDETAGEALYRQVLKQSRRPDFYLAGGVADTLDGRFDLLVLNVVLVLRRLKADGDVTSRLSQTLFDAMFRDLDESLREIGVGDMSIGSKVKDMAQAFYGRAAAYDDVLGSGAEDELTAVLLRNLYRNTGPPPEAVNAMASYIRRQVESLDQQSTADLVKGNVRFESLGKVS